MGMNINNLVLESINPDHFIYHFVDNSNLSLSLIKKHGLCSPRCLYDTDKILFTKLSFTTYKDRTSKKLNIPLDKVTPEDVLYYLDNASHRKGLYSSNSIFFSLIPFDMYNLNTQNKIKNSLQIKINTKKLHKYPVTFIIDNDKSIKTTWSHIEGPEVSQLITKQAQTDPTYFYKFAFANFPHLSVDCYHIPYDQFDEIMYI